ncbi:hypothetical protein F4780DRAFT_763613 [Xylariomycetidae sp. FL0641]|nr:hypothetical protein F4780DRAFT_763613 [Xylariomycetidae sp. FL0641]
MSHQGGDLNDMAAKGTSVPNDAGKMNTIPSKADPHQAQASATAGGLGASSLNTAADNPAGVPAADDNAVSATGHAVPTQAFEKYSEAGGKEREPR